MTCRNNLELKEVILVQPDDSDMQMGTFCAQYVMRLQNDKPQLCSIKYFAPVYQILAFLF